MKKRWRHIRPDLTARDRLIGAAHIRRLSTQVAFKRYNRLRLMRQFDGGRPPVKDRLLWTRIRRKDPHKRDWSFHRNAFL